MNTPILLFCLLIFTHMFSCSTDECEGDAECDDGLFCNGSELCVIGQCLPSGENVCNDNKECTLDTCDEELDECLYEATDVDGDGHFSPDCDGEDCDDRDDSIFPGAEELCDGKDNDCDGTIAEDKDHDGHYDPLLCSEGDDCDDEDDDVFPGAIEVCDGIDNNCLDGTDDEEDTDGDGAIDATCGCEPGDECDCDDENGDVYPSAPEVCNGADDNCNNEPDEDFECILGELYLCETICKSEGTVECANDCTLPDDPENCEPPEEVCNGLDDDCNDLPDDTFPCVAGELTECLTDCASMGTGICTNTCESPSRDQCIAPAEICNGIDDNCNGPIDEGWECPAGLDSPCLTECDTEGAPTGTGPCSSDCTMASPGDCVPPQEICDDFIDNDCDQDIDCTDEDCIGEYVCGTG